jgi:hypothetical protein
MHSEKLCPEEQKGHQDPQLCLPENPQWESRGMAFTLA